MKIIKRKYIPTDASVIRTMALAKGMAEQGCDVELLYILKNPNEHLPLGSDHLKIKCLSESCNSKFKIICFIYGVLSLVHRINKGDIIIMACFILPLLWLLSFFRINLYHERTEYPPLMFHNTLIGKLEEKIYIRICKKTDGVFVISNKIKDYFVKRGVHEGKVHVINMVVDSTRFEGLSKSEEHPYIAYCGTASNYKDGVDCLLTAFGIFHRKRPDVFLHIYGQTPSEKDRKLNNSIIEKNNLNEVVIMPGRIPANEIPVKLKNATMLVLARPSNVQSLYGFPTKLGEYLLTGNPVVVTRVGELDHFLEDKVSCIFAMPNDPVDLARQIEWGFENYELAYKIGKEGERVALRSFNYKTEATKIVRIVCA